MSKFSQKLHSFKSGLALRFALRELRGGLKGFRIFIACIALGVGAISGVASLSRSLIEGIANESQAILGGDFSVTQFHQEVSPEQSEFIGTFGKISKMATMRTMARIPDSTDAFGETLVEVKAIDDIYPLYGEIKLEGDIDLASALQMSQGTWGVVVDSTLGTQIDVGVGDIISIGNINVRIAGIIEQEPDLLSQNLVIGPRLMLSEQALKESGLVQPGSLVEWAYRVRINENRPATTLEIFNSLKAIDEKFPDAGWRLRTRNSAAPGLVSNIRRFAQFLTLVGITGLIVGGVGVANAVRSFLETKLKVIASFKSVGASGDFVFLVYLLQILMLAGIGISIGIVIGAIVPAVLTTLLATILPIPAEFAIYPSQLSLGVIYGFLTALAFALWPLGRAHDIPATALFRDSIRTDRPKPRTRYIVFTILTILALCWIAISNSRDTILALFYIGASLIAYTTLIGIAQIIKFVASRFPLLKSTSARLAIANIHRPGSLTSSVVLSLGLGLTLLVTMTLIDGNIRGYLAGSLAQNAPSFFFIDIQNEELPEFQEYVEGTVPEAIFENAPMLRGRIIEVKDKPAYEVRATGDGSWALRGDRGITYSATLPSNSTLVEGEWWEEDHEGDYLVSMESEVAEGIGVKIGDTITVNVLGKRFKATIANLRKVEWRSMAINFVLVFSPNTFEKAPHAHLATVTWEEDSTFEQEQSLHRAVAREFPTVTTVNVKNAINQVNELLSQLAWAIRGVSSITLIASILVLGGALAAGHQNRVYDSVVLKTLGATRSKLLFAYILEYLVLGTATAFFAVIVGAIAAWFVIVEIMDGEFTFFLTTALLAVVVALVLTVGFGLIGTWRVLGEKAAPVLRNL